MPPPRFRILERLATGGMAHIDLAVEQGRAGFERFVVLKRLKPQLSSDPDVVEMFLKEARLVALITHPNVVKIHELLEYDGTWTILMEYVSGSTLRELLLAAHKAEVLLPVNVVLGIVIQALGGLHAAHDLRDAQDLPLDLVHRDVAPDNLIVNDDGHVVLLDFGIAKAEERLMGEDTGAGTLKGKIPYMSPEQAQQAPLDRRSDLFSLGIIAWELLTGRRLFRRDRDYDALQAVVSAQVQDPCELRPEIPPAVGAALLRALQSNPEARYSTAEEMRRALVRAAPELDLGPDAVGAEVRRLLGEAHAARRAGLMEKAQAPDPEEPPPPPAPREAPASRTPALALAATVLLLTGLGVGGLFSARGPTGEPLRLGLAPVMDEAVIRKDHEPLRLHLQEALNRPVEWVVPASYEATVSALLAGDLDGASLPPWSYVQARQASPDLRILALKRIDGSSGVDGVLLVGEDFQGSSLADLAGKKVCFTDSSSSTGYRLPRAALERAGVPESALGGAIFSGNHLQAVRDLESGRCEAAATYSGMLRSGERAGVGVARTRVLGLTGRTPQDAFVAAPDLPAAEADALGAALLAYAAEEAPEAVERLTGFAKGRDADFDDLRKAAAGP